MQYIDLILSFILFVMGILSFFVTIFRANLWVQIASLLFFPIALIAYYFPDLNITLMGNIPLVDFLLYPFVKILILLAFFRYISAEKKRV
jgi:hypothetical protein